MKKPSITMLFPSLSIVLLCLSVIIQNYSNRDLRERLNVCNQNNKITLEMVITRLYIGQNMNQESILEEVKKIIKRLENGV